MCCHNGAMSEPFIAEINMFAGNFAPRSWAYCDGQLLAISTNTALFSLIGTIYGGDGYTTTALPDMRGRFPTHMGNGPGLSNRLLGSKSGVETVTLNQTQIPAHSHNIPVVSSVGNAKTPGNNKLAQSNDGENNFSSATADGNMQTASDGGSSQPHTNMPPYLTVNFIIALQGVFPSRS